MGKGHLGYQTMDHLPVINRGFDSHVGCLEAGEDYHWGNRGAPEDAKGQCDAASPACKKDMWHWHNLLLAPGTTW